MSVRVCWGEAGAVDLEVLRHGEVLPDSQQVDAPFALAISTDEVLVIEGSREELVDLLERGLSALQDPALR